MRLQDVMHDKVETITARETADAAWERMRGRRIHHLVVVDGKSVVGVVSERDIRSSSTRSGRRVSEVMTAPAATASPHTTLREAANLMRGRTIGCLPVVDRQRLVGIVTTTDILELIGRGVQRPVPRPGRRVLERRGRRREPLARR